MNIEDDFELVDWEDCGVAPNVMWSDILEQTASKLILDSSSQPQQELSIPNPSTQAELLIFDSSPPVEHSCSTGELNTLKTRLDSVTRTSQTTISQLNNEILSLRQAQDDEVLSIQQTSNDEIVSLRQALNDKIWENSQLLGRVFSLETRLNTAETDCQALESE